jgi:hypothetical protein
MFILISTNSTEKAHTTWSIYELDCKNVGHTIPTNMKAQHWTWSFVTSLQETLYFSMIYPIYISFPVPCKY